MDTDRILMGHGSGGRLARKLITDIISPILENDKNFGLSDSAVFDLDYSKLAFTTDSYVIDPIFFPGGDIGKLAVSGTVNDLLVAGAKPGYLSLGIIVEEGFEIKNLTKILKSVRTTADEAGVQIATGDTKVLPRGKADGIFINTSGVGEVISESPFSTKSIKKGDAILLTGTLGDHSAAVMVAREGLAVRSNLVSDCAPLNAPLIALMEYGLGIKCMRDPTRGGLAAVLNEIALDGNAEIVIEEERIPVKGEVSAVCEILGLDPLYMANEGKAVIFVAASDAVNAVDTLRKHRLCMNTQIIGHVKESVPKGRVILKTDLGGERLVQMPLAEQLPRIC